jgi:hypothetical protein
MDPPMDPHRDASDSGSKSHIPLLIALESTLYVIRFAGRWADEPLDGAADNQYFPRLAPLIANYREPQVNEKVIV